MLSKAVYSLKLDRARSAARNLQMQFPDHPAGYTIFAETYWWQSQTDPGNQTIENDYYKAQELAVQKAESALQAGKYPKAELLAYLASAHGSYSRFQVTQKQAYFSALRAGLRAHRYAEQVYELDKNYYDIYVGLGAFNFFTGSLPGVIKPFAFLIGARGDRNLGLQQLQIAAEKARYSRTEARIVYYTAMLEDEQYSVAFPILEKLMSDYPDHSRSTPGLPSGFVARKRISTERTISSGCTQSKLTARLSWRNMRCSRRLASNWPKNPNARYCKQFKD